MIDHFASLFLHIRERFKIQAKFVQAVIVKDLSLHPRSFTVISNMHYYLSPFDGVYGRLSVEMTRITATRHDTLRSAPKRSATAHVGGLTQWRETNRRMG